LRPMQNADDKTQAIADTVNRYIATLVSGSADDLAGFYADDATLEDPVGGEVHIGGIAIRGFYSAIAAMECQCELVSLRVSGSEAAFQFRFDPDGRRPQDACRADRGDGVRRPWQGHRHEGLLVVGRRHAAVAGQKTTNHIAM